jgi:hypothetical protein
MGRSYGWWTRRVVLPPAQVGQTDSITPGDQRCQSMRVGQWVDVWCSLSTQGRPTMRAAFTAALSHEPRDGLRLNEERSVRRWL